MKIYDFVGAPNPKKLRVYLAEKGISVRLEPVDIITGANRKPEFLAKNPLGGLPVLELDDGTHLPESLAIIEYFEELHPTPPMIGSTPLERARVRALERIAELGVLGRVA
ncbi:MAG TPA: glutathione S-transferase N-terminal domain-containing protein, partial [Candidatus Bathyarchaeia archaeon]|nr:glutathione S-transferase N-terminal domain-containing protein [Candidatus Bathyarchaeia archaeon]